MHKIDYCRPFHSQMHAVHHPDEEHRRNAVVVLPRKSNAFAAKGSKKDSKTIDEKLNQQFRYFRSEFMNAASSSGVTVPLDIVEDNSGRVFSFVKQSGPEYILQMLLTETESIHLLRISLSLLIVTVLLLRRKLPSSEGGSGNVMFSTSFSNSMSDWVSASLHHISDGGAVSVCINLLTQTYLEDIHELIIGLLAHLISVSKDAAAQMLQPLNSHLNYDHGSKIKARTEQVSSDPDRDRDIQSARVHNMDSRQALGEASIPELPQYHQKKSGTVAVKADSSSCMSYLLSVCALYRNRLVVMAGCADVIIGVANAYADGYFSYLVAHSPTCYLPVVASLGSKVNHSKSHRSNSQAASSQNNSNRPQTQGAHKRGSAPVDTSEPQRISSYGIVDWAGVKLLLKFLLRMEMFRQDQTEDTYETQNSFSATDSTMHDLEVSLAQKKTFLALSTLIAKSTEVAEYVLGLPGAEELLKLSGSHLVDDSDTNELVTAASRCFEALDVVKNRLLAERTKNAPPLSRLAARSTNSVDGHSRGRTSSQSSVSSMSRGPMASTQRTSSDRKQLSEELDADSDGEIVTAVPFGRMSSEYSDEDYDYESNRSRSGSVTSALTEQSLGNRVAARRSVPTATRRAKTSETRSKVDDSHSIADSLSASTYSKRSSTADSTVSRFLRGLPQIPKLPEVVPGILTSSHSDSSLSPTRSASPPGTPSAVFDAIARNEMKRLLRKGK